MSIKERIAILSNGATERLLISDEINNSLLVSDSRNCEIPRSEINILTEKNLDENIIKEVGLSHIRKITSSEYIQQYFFNCGVCQNLCKSCRSICVTCKSPCSKCVQQICKNSSTDTDDFDKYLESLSKKVKIQPKVKTTGTDTCDLEGHFDYYKLEKKTVRIQKHVATDCVDLNLRKPVIKKPNKISIGIDTSDLLDINLDNKENEDSDYEFFWNEKKENKTYIKKPTLERLISRTKQYDGNTSETSLIIDEDSSLHPSTSSVKEGEDNKENFNIESASADLVCDNSSMSDESDVDLATSSKVFKCKQLAEKHKIKLKKVNKDKNVVFECVMCCESFPKKHLGLLHLGSHLEDNCFKCLTCGNNFSSSNLLLAHIKESHSSELKSEKKSKLESENKENSDVDLQKSKINKIYKCTLCSNECETFNSLKNLILHKREKHGIEKSKANESESKTEKKPRIKKEFICLLCGKQFKSSKALKDHSPVHTGEKNYHCDICNKSYTTSANLKIHKRTHTGARDFVCTVCGKAFHKKDSLKVHFRKHSGERPFQCDLCPMKFDRNYILKNHRYTHFSEKTFICPVCGKTFTTHGGLNNHEKSHKKDPFVKKPRKAAVKPTLDTENAVICDVCGKIYSTKNNLRIHKFVHLGVKPFECTICHQTYAKKDSMLIHMRKHTDERPFACETCGMTFYRNHTLKTHLLRHTGERPHKCKMCGKSFTQSSSLAYHIKNHDKKVEKKKTVVDDLTKQKKKRINPGSSKSGNLKKIPKLGKSNPEEFNDNNKSIFDGKKPIEGPSDLQKDSIVLNIPEKGEPDIIKGGHFLLPVPEKEVLILDKNVEVEFPRNSGKEIDFFGLDKDTSYYNQYNLGKFNYYIAKSHVFSFPKEITKEKSEGKEIEISIKEEEDVENLIISKTSYITKEGNLVTLNRDSSLKDLKEEFVHIGEERLDVKSQSAIPITGEILNTAFISDENGDVIPLGSMTLQGLNAENIMISPFIPFESDERKGLLRNSKLAVFDSKITYNLASPRGPNDKVPGKGNSHIINLKDPRTSQKIQIELDPPPIHIHTPVVDVGTLHGVSGFYNNTQPNEI